jgi:hypothetical protein
VILICIIQTKCRIITNRSVYHLNIQKKNSSLQNATHTCLLSQNWKHSREQHFLLLLILRKRLVSGGDNLILMNRENWKLLCCTFREFPSPARRRMRTGRRLRAEQERGSLCRGARELLYVCVSTQQFRLLVLRSLSLGRSETKVFALRWGAERVRAARSRGEMRIRRNIKKCWEGGVACVPRAPQKQKVAYQLISASWFRIQMNRGSNNNELLDAYSLFIRAALHFFFARRSLVLHLWRRAQKRKRASGPQALFPCFVLRQE